MTSIFMVPLVLVRDRNINIILMGYCGVQIEIGHVVLRVHQKLPSRRLCEQTQRQVSGYVKLQIQRKRISGREGILSQTWQCARFDKAFKCRYN